MALDHVKRGRGPVVVKTLAVTLLIVLASCLQSIFAIQRAAEAGLINPTDQVLMSQRMLEASLLGKF